MALFVRRSDGWLVGGLSSYQAFFPYLLKKRSQSQLFVKQQLLMDGALEYLERKNVPGALPLTLFHLFVAAAVRTLALRPHLNRFVKGKRIFEHKRIEISFVVKKELKEESGVSVAKIAFEPADTLAVVQKKIEDHLTFKRGASRSREERERDVIMRLPHVLIGLAESGARFLDRFGLLPEGMIAADPLYASVFLSNHGSIGLDATYHHLFDWGTVSLFIILGKLHEAAVVINSQIVVKHAIDATFTLDNRIVDGLYAANGLKLFRDLIQNPASLEAGAG